MVPRAEARVAVADAEGEAEVAAAAGKTMVRAGGDGGVEAVAAVGNAQAVPISSPSKTATFHANQGKGYSSFIPTDTDSCAAPRTITPANELIRLFLER